METRSAGCGGLEMDEELDGGECEGRGRVDHGHARGVPSSAEAARPPEKAPGA